MATMTARKTRTATCPTCQGPAHRDPVTGRYTSHAKVAPEPAPAPEPLPQRKRGLFRRRTA